LLKGKSIATVSIIVGIIIVTTIIDTSIVGIVTSSGGLTASTRDLGFFAFTVILLAVGQFIIHHFVQTEDLKNGHKIANVKLYPIGTLVSILVYILVTLLAFTFVEMIFTKSYHLIVIKLVILISYGTSFCLLAILAWRLLSWLKTSFNLNVFLYFLAICLVSINAIITIAYLYNEFSDNPDVIKPRRSLPGLFASPDVIFGTAYTLTSVMSFVMMWLATAVSLRNYSSKLAKIKFWIIIVLPLAYFLGQFQPLILYSFSDFRTSDPITFGIVYNIVISASKPLGAVLFGLAFWQTSKSIRNNTVKKYLIISAYGMTLLFTSNQPLGLIFAPYPPFGLSTISYMSFASYLILAGIYASAISVANDTNLRRSIKDSVNKRTNLLNDIGTAQMKNQFESMIMRQTRLLSSKMENETGIKASLEEDELKRYIDIAIQEAKNAIRKK